MIVLCKNSYGQITPNPNEYEEQKPVLLRNEWSFGIHLHTSGWGIEVKRGRNITAMKKLMFETQFVSMKHPKEVKTINPLYENSKSYVFGKINTLNILRASAGFRHTIYSKADNTGVEVRVNYMAGASIGFAKPIYLEVYNEDQQLETRRSDPETQTVEDIYGRAPFTEGLDQIKIYPGGFVKGGFNFEYAPFHEDIKAIEVGAALDIFPTPVPIMALTKNKQLFLTFYLTFIYGRKW